MNAFFDFFALDSLVPLGGLILILLWVGHQAVGPSSRLRVWGKRLGLLAFIIYGAAEIALFSYRTAGELLELAVRSLFASGLVMSLSWIPLPVVAYVSDQGTGWVSRRKALAEARRKAREMKKHMAEEARRQKEKAEHQREEAERERPLREQREREQASAQQRRAEARAACELLYNLHAQTVRKRFGREVLADWLTKYMGDEHTPEVVEQRSRRLQAAIRELAQQAEPPKPAEDTNAIAAERERKENALPRLIAWYQSERSKVESLVTEPREKEDLLLELAKRYDQLTKECLRDMKP